MRTIAVAATVVLIISGCADRAAPVEQPAEAQVAPVADTPVAAQTQQSPATRAIRLSSREWQARLSVSAEIERLTAEDPVERARAAARIGDLASSSYADRVEGDPLDALPHLISLLDDETPIPGGANVHPNRAAILPTTPGNEAVMAIVALSYGRQLDVGPVLEALVDASTAFERQNIARVLTRIPDERSIGPLVKLLDDPDAEVRAAAAAALAALESKETIDPLLAAYEVGRIDTLTAVKSLGQLANEDDRVLDLMIETARTGDEDERVAAVEPLMYHAWDIYSVDRSDPRTERIINVVLETLRTDPSEEVREAALPSSRSHFRREVDEALIEALLSAIRSDPSPRVRMGALRKFNESKRMAADEAVLIAYDDEHPGVRRWAFDVGRTIYDSEHHEGPGIDGLEDPSWEVRVAAARMLGEGSGQDVRDALAETIVTDGNEDVRCWANYSLQSVLRKFSERKIQWELAQELDPVIMDTGESDRVREATAHTMLVSVEGPYPDPGPDDMDVIQWWRDHRDDFVD